MMPVQRPSAGQLAKAHTFRFLTMIATWVLIFAAFLYHPEWIRAWLRLMTHAIETLADQVPEPWGARFEVMLRELGGMIWIQIASAIVFAKADRLVTFPPLAFESRAERSLPAGRVDTVTCSFRRVAAEPGQTPTSQRNRSKDGRACR